MIQDLRIFFLLLHVNYRAVTEKGDQLESEQPTQISGNIRDESSDEPIVFHFTHRNPTLGFPFQKGRFRSPMVCFPKTYLWMAALRKIISS